MQRKTLNLAVAAALLTLAGSASAAFTFNSGNTSVVNISGSSATNNQLKLFAQNVLCDSVNQTTINYDSNDYAVVCTPKSSVLTLPSGKTNIAVVKNSVGGSGQGITPEIAHSTLTFLNPFTNTLSTTAVPDIGMSDEEPALLVAAGAASGDVTKLTSSPLNVVTFGTPVTLGLRNALQTKEIAAGTLPSTCSAGNESMACMPSLSRGQIASIFTGQTVGWSEFGLTNPAGDDNIYIAKRVITSGTQTGSRVFFLNDPCSGGVISFVNADIAESNTKADACNAASYSGARIFEASGSGNVETCVTNHDRNGRWAIGVNSTEYPGLPGADQTEAYTPAGGADLGSKINNGDHQRHIKIDGIAPITFNTAVNRYQNWVEATMNVSNVYTLSPDAAALQTLMVSDFNDPSVLNTINAGFNTTALLHAAGDTGVDAGIVAPAPGLPATPATPASLANTKASPQMFYTHSISGAPATCQPAMAWWATGIQD